MTRYYCQDHPSVHQLQARVVAVAPGRVLLERSPFFPGGRGQLADRGVLRAGDVVVKVEAISYDAKGVWHDIDAAIGEPDAVDLTIDSAFRQMQSELHTLAHIVNAMVFQQFDGALLTGAQLGDNGSIRVDFDLPGVDNNRLRALQDPINELLAADLPVSTNWMPWHEAQTESGLFRAKSTTPPMGDDGLVRIVQIGDLDRQACGGTHVSSTAMIRPIRITKIENKGRQNRRMRLSFAD